MVQDNVLDDLGCFVHRELLCTTKGPPPCRAAEEHANALGQRGFTLATSIVGKGLFCSSHPKLHQNVADCSSPVFAEQGRVKAVFELCSDQFHAHIILRVRRRQAPTCFRGMHLAFHPQHRPTFRHPPGKGGADMFLRLAVSAALRCIQVSAAAAPLPGEPQNAVSPAAWELRVRRTWPIQRAWVHFAAFYPKLHENVPGPFTPSVIQTFQSRVVSLDQSWSSVAPISQRVPSHH